jgi:tetratricopeptide (TPR) repeat protein
LMTRPSAPLAASLNPVTASGKPVMTPTPLVEFAPDLGTGEAMKSSEAKKSSEAMKSSEAKKTSVAMKKPAPDDFPAQAGSVPPAPVRHAQAAPATRVSREPSVVVSNFAAPQINPVAVSAYSALQAGHLDEAQSLYQKLATSDQRNLDASLGMAAVALQKGHADQAGKYYMQALEADPKNAAAQAGLIGLIGSADPLASESRLKQLLANQPSAFLYFTLGNLYAEQGKWPAAEQAYFQAQQLEPANADYAFNLAVSLEHLNQPAIALTYYRRAQQFANDKGRVHFDTASLAARLAQLTSTSSEEKH